MYCGDPGGTLSPVKPSRRPGKRCVVWLLWPAAMVCLTAGVWWGAALYPGGYDWQYRVISSLASREDNPAGYVVFCAGLALCFLILLPLPGYFRARLRHTAPGLARFSYIALLTGMLFSAAVGVERILIPNLSELFHKSHELIALIAFLGLFFGVAGFWVATFQRLRAIEAIPRWLLVVLFGGLVAPILCSAACQLYLYLTRSDLGWVDPTWRDRGVPLYLSFAFWQWLTGLGTFLYMLMIAAVLPGGVRDHSSGSRSPASR
jgi:hypothetical protein